MHRSHNLPWAAWPWRRHPCWHCRWPRRVWLGFHETWLAASWEILYMGASINGGIQNSWFILENPIEKDDLGIPLFYKCRVSWENTRNSFTCGGTHNNERRESSRMSDDVSRSVCSWNWLRRVHNSFDSALKLHGCGVRSMTWFGNIWIIVWAAHIAKRTVRLPVMVYRMRYK